MINTLSPIDYKVDIFALFMLLGIGQGLFLSFVFFIKKNKNNSSNIYFGILLLSASLSIIEIFLNYTHYILNIISLFSFANSFVFLSGPLLFIYVYMQLYGKLSYKWLHFIPFALYFIYYLFYFNLQTEALKYNAYIYAYNVDLPLISQAERRSYFFINSLKIQPYYSLLSLVHYCIYQLSLLYIVLKYFSKRSIKFFSINDLRLRWIRNLIIIFLLMFLISGAVRLTVELSTLNYLGGTMLAGVIYIISFNYITRSVFFKDESSIEKTALKYAKSSLSDDEKRKILKKIKEIMEYEQLYKDNMVSLSILSKKVGVSSNHVSQAINECLQQNFYDFLASYRIEEAKKMLRSNKYKNLTIEQIAYEVGYNSKSAFFKAFKTITHESPSLYRTGNKE